MATLREYFAKDGEANLTLHQYWPLNDVAGAELGQVTARLHYDFDARALYVSFYLPDMPGVECPEALALNELPKILKWPHEALQVQGGRAGELKDARDLVFTGQVYLYSERAVSEENRARLSQEATAAGHNLTFRSTEYVAERDKWQKPKAVISHDSRDKPTIAEPLALQLSKLMVPVWYDQYSLKVGDSLRESIELGLRECEKCIFVITPNFLQNGGWSKREYDSVFTRELVEGRKLILPVWHQVTVRDVFAYSPVLADRYALNWDDGIEKVAAQLQGALTNPG